MTEFNDVIVVGSGLTGLAAARVLARNSVNYVVLEMDADVGGRMRTENFEGCIIDQGFQVVLPAYPSFQALKLPTEFMAFSRAATCISPKGNFVVADPIHNPGNFVANLGRTKSTIPDYFRLMRHIYSRRFDLSTKQLFEVLGYSEGFKNSFLRPFLQGVLLDPNLESASPLSSYYLQRFFYGGAALVKGGIQEFPRAIAKDLNVRFRTEVSEVSQSEIRSLDGHTFAAKIIIDTRPNAIHENVTWLGTRCHYFLSSKPVKLDRNILLCSIDLPTRINHIANLSEVDPSYSPEGTALLSVTSRDKNSLDINQIHRELVTFLDLPHRQINHLKSVDVKHGVPLKMKLSLDFPEPIAPMQVDQTIFASDTLSFGSQHAALRMGKRAGEMAISVLKS